jgi:hypothetical protein
MHLAANGSNRDNAKICVIAAFPNLSGHVLLGYHKRFLSHPPRKRRS